MKGQKGQIQELQQKQRSDGCNETTAHKLMNSTQIQITAMEKCSIDFLMTSGQQICLPVSFNNCFLWNFLHLFSFKSSQVKGILRVL